MELRLKNYTDIGDQVKNLPYSPKELREAFKYGSAKINWATKRNAKPGQGVTTVAAMITSETLGIPIKKITVFAADTKSSALDLGSFGSSVTDSFGPALHNAA